MSILSTTATAPSGELNCIEIQQNSGGTITDWWYLPGTGFVDTQRTTNGYSRGYHDANDPHFGGLSRVAICNQLMGQAIIGRCHDDQDSLLFCSFTPPGEILCVW
jgi:hypothetical protein